MVELPNRLHGWTKSVYGFGCAFIRLSHLHDYRMRDRLQQVPEAEREAILRHLRYYHGGPGQPSPTFADIVPFLPSVFTKIADNLECYLREPEGDKDLDEYSASRDVRAAAPAAERRGRRASDQEGDET